MVGAPYTLSFIYPGFEQVAHTSMKPQKKHLTRAPGQPGAPVLRRSPRPPARTPQWPPQANESGDVPFQRNMQKIHPLILPEKKKCLKKTPCLASKTLPPAGPSFNRSIHFHIAFPLRAGLSFWSLSQHPRQFPIFRAHMEGCSWQPCWQLPPFNPPRLAKK